MTEIPATIAVPAATASAACQPKYAATGARISPASTPPPCAAACLSEKISPRCRAGAVAPSNRVVPGGIGP